ncbi:MAG: hypothetical protein AAFU60_05100 [Bacteroidota bacterium]
MRRRSIVLLSILTILVITGMILVNHLIDLRPAAIMLGISDSQYARGKVLLAEMEQAYGGKEVWLAKERGSYEQKAVWYGNYLVAGWDSLPQSFQMTSTLGTDNSEMTLLNGAHRGQCWGVESGKSYAVGRNGEKEWLHNEKYLHKLVYKNYWFQFPFRIGEAPIIAYAGEAEIDGKTYDLLYATWEKEAPNSEYDQYVLYVNKESKRIEWLHFTVREKFKSISFTAQFTNFREVDGALWPHSQYVSLGPPHRPWKRLHENHYQWIRFGE